MSLTIEPNMFYVQDRLNISTERMNKYSDKTVDEIIQAEAAQGNASALAFKQEYLGNESKLIKTLNLDNVGQKFRILLSMNDKQRYQILELLSNEDLILGLNFYTSDKLIDILNHVDIEELILVAFESFSLEDIIKMLPEKFVIEFFQNKDVEQKEVVKQMKQLPNEVLIQMIESITGKESSETNPLDIINLIGEMPDRKYKELMENMEPDVLRQLLYQMAHEDNKYLTLIPNEGYTRIIEQLQKPDIIKSCVALKKETLLEIIAELPKDLCSMVATQADTTKMAELLIQKDDYTEFLAQLLK